MDTLAVQTRLATLGFLPASEIDGIDGPITKAAVEAFQHKAGLYMDGIAGPLTRAKLFPAPSPAPKLKTPPAANVGQSAGHPLSAASEARLVGVHPDLVKVVRRAAEITTHPFAIVQGCRSVADEAKAVATGHSQTMRSRHIPSGHPPTAKAIDFAALSGGKIDWSTSLYLPIVATIKQAAHEVGIAVEFGAEWHSFKDYGHVQLSWALYP